MSFISKSRVVGRVQKTLKTAEIYLREQMLSSRTIKPVKVSSNTTQIDTTRQASEFMEISLMEKSSIIMNSIAEELESMVMIANLPTSTIEEPQVKIFPTDEDPTPLYPGFKDLSPGIVDQCTIEILQAAEMFDCSMAEEIKRPFCLGDKKNYSQIALTRRLAYSYWSQRDFSKLSKHKSKVLFQYQTAVFLAISPGAIEAVEPSYPGSLEEDTWAIIHDYDRLRPLSDLKREILAFKRTLMMVQYGGNCPESWRKEGTYDHGFWKEVILAINSEIKREDESTDRFEVVLKTQCRELGIPPAFVEYLKMLPGPDYMPFNPIKVAYREKYRHAAHLLVTDHETVSALATSEDSKAELELLKSKIRLGIKYFFQSPNLEDEPEIWAWMNWKPTESYYHRTYLHRSRPSARPTKNAYIIDTPVQVKEYLSAYKSPAPSPAKLHMASVHYNPTRSSKSITPPRSSKVPEFATSKMWEHRQPPLKETVMLATGYELVNAATQGLPEDKYIKERVVLNMRRVMGQASKV